jgi:hypothetical protein
MFARRWAAGTLGENQRSYVAWSIKRSPAGTRGMAGDDFLLYGSSAWARYLPSVGKIRRCVLFDDEVAHRNVDDTEQRHHQVVRARTAAESGVLGARCPSDRFLEFRLVGG